MIAIACSAAVGLAACDDDGRPSQPAEAPTTSVSAGDECDGDTVELSRCLRSEVERLDGVLAELNDQVASLPQPDTPESLADLWEASAELFDDYRAATCEAVFIQAIEGSYRAISQSHCELNLIEERIALLQEQLKHRA